MKTIQDSGFRVLDWRSVSLAALCLVCLAGCGGMPSFPDPKPGQGQIVVELKGEPRAGVTGPARETVMDEYEVSSRSVEEGEAFERVDYDAIEDVVVILDAASSGRRSTAPNQATVEIDEAGFSHSQLLLAGVSELPTSLLISNSRRIELNVFGFSDTDEYVEVTIEPGQTGRIEMPPPGRYELMCDEDEGLHCTLFVTATSYAWIGSSDEFPFFNGLAPGSYEVSVFAPRLPEIVKAVDVAAGKRTKVIAELTVNDLPKAE